MRKNKQEKEVTAKGKAEKRKKASRQRVEKKANKDDQLSASKSSTRLKSTRRYNSIEVGQQSSSTEALLSNEDPGVNLESLKPPPEELTEDANQCCVCFEMYEPNTKWVQCVCKRWLHEDFYIVDKYGRELLCPFCVP